MNYRHAYHAGNVGDVLKHAVLARVLAWLATKEAGFAVVDTHAGAGDYDLGGAEARATGEWEAGIGRLDAGAALTPAMESFLAPWRALGARARAERRGRYPGSPALARIALRSQDRAVFLEKHPETCAALRSLMRGDTRVTVEEIDGWSRVPKLLPPRERRGVVLIDPPFEDRRDYVTMVETLAACHRRFATGTYLLWYPVKGEADIKGMCRALVELAIPKTLRLELRTRVPNHPNRFDGAGLIVVNPPWTLQDDAAAALPALAERLATGPSPSGLVEWLVPERAGDRA
jgi:23S rRNA (adenine2030-N6)-methyltransferase